MFRTDEKEQSSVDQSMTLQRIIFWKANACYRLRGQMEVFK